MKVYSLMEYVDYEGGDLLGVFGSLEDLRKCVEDRGLRSKYSRLCYVECELGQVVDGFMESVEL